MTIHFTAVFGTDLSISIHPVLCVLRSFAGVGDGVVYSPVAAYAHGCAVPKYHVEIIHFMSLGQTCTHELDLNFQVGCPSPVWTQDCIRLCRAALLGLSEFIHEDGGQAGSPNDADASGGSECSHEAVSCSAKHVSHRFHTLLVSVLLLLLLYLMMNWLIEKGC